MQTTPTLCDQGQSRTYLGEPISQAGRQAGRQAASQPALLNTTRQRVRLHGKKEETPNMTRQLRTPNQAPALPHPRPPFAKLATAASALKSPAMAKRACRIEHGVLYGCGACLEVGNPKSGGCSFPLKQPQDGGKKKR